MFTRSIVIQRRVEDLQLVVESYQKKINLTRPDMYRSNLKQLPTYLAYPNLRGFIYQNKDKKNILMRIDELPKFSDGTLNDVRTALDDILKRIRMKLVKDAGGGYTRLGNQAFTPRTLRSPSNPDRVHICAISGAIRGTYNN
ncbi:hypothetical protein Tco_0201933 [Tanacetum coccineum]